MLTFLCLALWNSAALKNRTQTRKREGLILSRCKFRKFEYKSSVGKAVLCSFGNYVPPVTKKHSNVYTDASFGTSCKDCTKIMH